VVTNRPHAEPQRPSPDALLRAATRADRSRLKIFMGAAPGVGKTFAMLQAAWERKRDGVDVVVGVVETHGRADTQALLDGLEAVPRKTIEYRGTALAEMDLDAILARRPQLVLIDELAHTNAPGSRHPKRYSDVEELLDAGIEVYTTVNIQHLESLNDVVAQITGVRVRETVPDGIFERADEVKLVDLPPEDLLQRLREGKVYVPPQAARAIENFFSPGNLAALRELALRHTAERVDEDVRAYMQEHAITGTWAVRERIMVCVREGPLGERLVRAARRMAARRRAEWLAVFVETPTFARRPEAERSGVATILRLAEQLGAEAVTIPGQDVAAEIVRYAQERNVTEIMLGKSLRPWWRELLRRSPIAQVIRQSGDIAVHVLTAARETRGPERGAPRLTTPARPRLARYAVALTLVAVAGVVAVALQRLIALTDPAMVFLTAVLFTAVQGGLGPSITAAVASVLVYDFFFVDPILTFTVTKPQDVFSLVVFLIVAALTSQLTARARDQAEAARQREARTSALYAFSRAIAGAIGADDLLPIVAAHVSSLFKADAAVLVPDGGRLVVRAREPASTVLGEAELAAATWVWRHDEAAGPGTDTLPGGEWLHVPLQTARGVVGGLSLRVAARGGALPLEQRQLLEALARQTAIALERTRIDVVLEQKAKTEAVIEAIEDGLIVLDPQGVVVDVNEVACAILELERDQLLGASFQDLATMHPHYLRVREAVRELLANPERERDRVEITLFLRGRDHHYVLRPTPFRAPDGSPAGLILTLQDVTYLRDQEARRENLVATLSHELRTPLTSLRMALELLRKRGAALDDEQRGLLDAAHDDAMRLQDVAQQFLDLARTRAMAIAFDRHPIELAAVVVRVAKLFAVQAREQGVALETTIAAPGTILGDETKLTWALSNLVANALRYTPAGGTVTIATDAKGGNVLVSVSDTGPGIPPERQERIFERFVQEADGGTVGAAGLGLAIVRDFVQAHGGRILLDSGLGRGTRFTLELPRS
jgi:two-component system sensor histidine kinase KdpD